MNLLWITDPHFPFLRKEQQSLWDKLLIESGSDGLLLGGDLAEAPALERWLSHVVEIYPRPIAFVTGNHDFYHASIAEIRSRLGRFAKGSPRLSIFEPGLKNTPIQFPGTQVWLCATGGWGDAQAGTCDATDKPLNDENYIHELIHARDEGRLNSTLRGLGAESADHLCTQLDQIPLDAKAVVILTHVPPWPASAWHEGTISPPAGLARFCCVALGSAIHAAARIRPATKFLVLCGHAHSGGLYEFENIQCHTGGCSYGQVHHNALLSISESAVALRRLDGVIRSNGSLSFQPLLADDQ